ncbi:MAG: hypothetical protein MUQ48_01175, partial [Pirellulales bacterium]|nr:hypothetical protein [Pirellulales bacterium]
NTNISTIVATISGASQGLTLNETNGLAIGSSAVQANNGSITLNLAAGNLTNAVAINAGSSGNVTLLAPAGSINSSGLITANVLSTTSLNNATLNTNVAGLNSTITAAGNLLVNEANNLTVVNAKTSNGSINLTTPTTSNISVTSINAASGTSGNVTLIGGNLTIDAPGITATNIVDLRGIIGTISIAIGGRINAPTVLTNSPIYYTISSSADSGPGSLRDALNGINSSNYNTAITILTPTTINLTSPLPAMTKTLILAGNNYLTLNGAAAGVTASGLTLTSTATGSSITGVELLNFGGAGIDIIGTKSTIVSNVIVTNSGSGVRASGDVAGTSVTLSTFNWNTTGIELNAVQNMQVGKANQQGNIINGRINSTGAIRTLDGIKISGLSTGTKAYGNLITGASRGISLIGASNLTVGGYTATQENEITACTTGVYATGFCNNSFVIKTKITTTPTPYNVTGSRYLTIVQ